MSVHSLRQTAAAKLVLYLGVSSEVLLLQSPADRLLFLVHPLLAMNIEPDKSVS